MNIQAPKRRDTHPDQPVDCRDAMDKAFHELMANTIAAGWGPQEVADAISQPTEAHLMARFEKAATEAQIKQARRNAEVRRQKAFRHVQYASPRNGSTTP
jgi:hypothetical protein